MSNVEFNLSKTDGSQTCSVFITKDDGEYIKRVVTRANPSFATLVGYLTSTDEHDADKVHRLVDPAVAIGQMLQAEFGDRVTFDLRHFYIDGIPETSALARVVKDKALNGDTDWERLARFLVRLERNPSKRAKDAIWEWVEKHGVSVTEDGRIAGFKGLVSGTDAVTGETNVPVSYHSGPNNFIDGTLYGEAGVAYQVPHRVGTVISKRRADVDDSGKLACSTGLHVGAYSYAKTFGENRDESARYSTMGRMATSLPNSTFAIVVFAPEDVVSVPEDHTADWKIRVERYEVSEFLEEVKDVLKDKPTYNVQTPAPFLPRSEPFQAEPTVEPEPEEDEDDFEPEDEDADFDPDAEDEEATDLAEVQAQPEPEFVGSPDLTLAENAAQIPDLKRDLEDTNLGHKPLARKWEHITSEASVRRYRKATGIKVSLGSRVKDALS